MVGIRVGVMLFLIYKAYGETGWATATLIFFIWLSLETIVDKLKKDSHHHF